MITVNVTATDYVITATEAVSNITVVADNSIFTVTSVSTNVTVTNTTPVITFDTEGAGFDFAIKHRGEWESGATYTRNDVVRYQYSIYICQISFTTTLTSSTPPPDDPTNWELFVFNEWPRSYLTVTNQLTAGSLSVLGNSTFSGRINVLGTSTFANGSFTNLTVSNQFAINGLNYPVSRGAYGQVLSTDGTSTAAWVNLGDLVFWSLSSDLQTNGFNIVTGSEVGVPNPQLTIGSGETGNLKSRIQFLENSGNIAIAGPRITLVDNDIGSLGEIDIQGDNITLSQDVLVTGELHVTGDLSGTTDADPVNIGPGGILFSDGTNMTSTNITIGGTGTFSVPIASSTVLGVIRVGQYLLINPSTGVLSVDANNLPSNYTLPAATANIRGGIRVGSGLTISGEFNDVLSVSTSSAFGNVSLTEDMLTNGYLIKHGTAGRAGQLYLENDKATLRLNTENERIVIAENYLNVEHPTIIDLKAPIVRVGTDTGFSRLHVGRIYNYAGVGAPLFPAGVQFPDQTIQVTAYDDGRFDNGDLNEIPYFTNSSWQALITYLVGIDFLDPNLVWTEEDLG